MPDLYHIFWIKIYHPGNDKPGVIFDGSYTGKKLLSLLPGVDLEGTNRCARFYFEQCEALSWGLIFSGGAH